MKRIGVREFRDHATKYLAGDEVLAIERHGNQIGVYIPTKATRREPVKAGRREDVDEALERLGETVQRVLEETGMSEDELADFFDLNKPVPELPEPRTSERLTTTHAAGH
ncbi:MAG: hypothetical protein ACRDJH_05490 [Thermomicrobiales bacterium]